MTEEKPKSKEVLVVAQLPEVPTREIENSDGKEFTAVTIEEALTEILKICRKLEKNLG